MEPQCVGRLEIAEAKKPVAFLCGTLPVPTDVPLFHSALLPSPHSIGAPRYQMLPAETDLNTLPLLSNFTEKVFPAAADKAGGGDLHWESSSITQNLSRKCEALAVSGLAEYGDEIDVVAPTDILKQIFKIPYSKAQLSITVHRIGDTLILNTGPDFEEGEKMFRRQSNQSKGSSSSIFLNFAMHSVRAEACDCPPTHKPSTDKETSSTMLPGHFGHPEDPYVSSTNACVGNPQYIDESTSQKSSQGDSDKFFWGSKKNKQKHRSGPAKRTTQVGEKPRCPIQESDKYKRAGDNGFLRVLFWQFHNFRMLLGSDLLLFSNEKYVAVSLHLWDVARQVTPLTWLEAWLDNVMASVPELAICYHQNGVVQGYELLKTDDIFLVKGVSDDGTPAFHPQIVQQNGLSVLRFLQDNCKQDPGAYWLYKSAGEDVIQLFDLSVIPKNHSTEDHDKSSGSFLSLMHRGRRESLFSLGTLLYRVAHRLSLSKAPNNRVRCARFFKKCLDFLSEQDHLVVRAYAHEQFARLILKCYEELDLTTESFLLESEVTVTDLEDESSEFSPEIFRSMAHVKVPSQNAEDASSTKDETLLQSSGSDTLGISEVELDFSLPPENTMSGSTEVEEVMESTPPCETYDSLVIGQMSETIPQVVRTVADPVSSKLAAIHHVSQAIKSLRWKRQLQNTDGDMIDHGNIIPERSSSVNFSLCACGDVDCIEVCDIREWLAKSKIDQKLWNLVLLLGESYLALGEAYKEDGQLHQALKVVEVACLVYGSMPQHLEDARFISSMVSSPSCQLDLKYGSEKETVMIESTKELDPKFFMECCSSDHFNSNYLFWSKTWTLVGDVYVEYYRIRGKETPVHDGKTSGSEMRMSNEVVREVKRLKKKLGRHQQNCSTCSLVNCSCQSDRASSGNSASSSSGDVPSSYGRKLSKKSNTRNSMHSVLGSMQEDSSSCKVENTLGDEHLPNNSDMHISSVETRRKEIFTAASVTEHKGTWKKQTTSSEEAVSQECGTKDASKVRQGGIFRFLDGPKIGDAEGNLLAAVGCYDEAMKALDGFPDGSTEFHSISKKKGWVCNELGRYRLENRNLASAEIAFIEAIKAFKEVSDATNIILINCNLGHGRRAIAEEMVSKIYEFKKYDVLQHAHKKSLKTAKMEYFESLRYYGTAKTEIMSLGDGVDTSLRDEVYTQYAHTYLRLGMLLAKEGISTEAYESGHIDELYCDGKVKGQRKHEMSASDAFREALSTYESLGELRKQEVAFAHFQLGCYQRDSCMKFFDLDKKQGKRVKCENNYRQRAKWYASLAEKNWQKSVEFYGPKTHPAMYLNIVLEQSALSLSLSSLFYSNTMLEMALLHLLEGRHVVVEANEDCSCIQDPEIIAKFWNHLQGLLKSMLAGSLSGSTNKSGGVSQVVPSSKAGDGGKLREMYRISLKSTDLGQLHTMHKLWYS